MEVVILSAAAVSKDLLFVRDGLTSGDTDPRRAKALLRMTISKMNRRG